jgi:hypothetical protein
MIMRFVTLQGQPRTPLVAATPLRSRTAAKTSIIATKARHEFRFWASNNIVEARSKMALAMLAALIDPRCSTLDFDRGAHNHAANDNADVNANANDGAVIASGGFGVSGGGSVSERLLRTLHAAGISNGRDTALSVVMQLLTEDGRRVVDVDVDVDVDAGDGDGDGDVDDENDGAIIDGSNAAANSGDGKHGAPPGAWSYWLLTSWLSCHAQTSSLADALETMSPFFASLRVDADDALNGDAARVYKSRRGSVVAASAALVAAQIKADTLAAAASDAAQPWRRRKASSAAVDDDASGARARRAAALKKRREVAAVTAASAAKRKRKRTPVKQNKKQEKKKKRTKKKTSKQRKGKKSAAAARKKKTRRKPQEREKRSQSRRKTKMKKTTKAKRKRSRKRR